MQRNIMEANLEQVELDFELQYFQRNANSSPVLLKP